MNAITGQRAVTTKYSEYTVGHSGDIYDASASRLDGSLSLRVTQREVQWVGLWCLLLDITQKEIDREGKR